jgi:hypothetical protein
MHNTGMFRMVCVMVCMKKIMAVFMQMGNGTAFSVFALRPMIVGMKIVIMLIVGILIMVVAVAMGSGTVMVMAVSMIIMTVGSVSFLLMFMSVLTLMIVSMGIMAVGPVLFLTVVVIIHR